MTVTVIFYDEYSLELKHEIGVFSKNGAGRVVLPVSFKEGKSIVAVIEGEVNILNKSGDRVFEDRFANQPKVSSII